MVNMYVQRRTMVQMIKNELRKRGLIIDIVPDDENESDDDDNEGEDDDDGKFTHLKPSGCSGVSPPFSLFDITHFMQLKKPPLTLLFDNEMFDHSYHSAIENSFYHRNQDKSIINSNINSKIDNDSNNDDDDHDTIIFRVNLSDDEEPEPESK